MEKSKYTVIWHYVANHGVIEVEAYTAEEAKDKVWNGRKDIDYYVVETANLNTWKGGELNGL